MASEKIVIPLNPISEIRVPDPRFVHKDNSPMVLGGRTIRIGDVVEAPYPNSRALIVATNPTLKRVLVHPLHYQEELDVCPYHIDEDPEELFVVTPAEWVDAQTLGNFLKISHKAERIPGDIGFFHRVYDSQTLMIHEIKGHRAAKRLVSPSLDFFN